MFGRKDEVVLTRLRLGHCCLASCFKVIGKQENGLCECGELERVVHVLFSCNLYYSQRQQLFIDLYDLGLPLISF